MRYFIQHFNEYRDLIIEIVAIVMALTLLSLFAAPVL